MSPPPTKRQRTEDAPLTRSDIWYKDGSVILQAENTQFRVHFSLLSQHSCFFRDLEDLPQPPDQPTVEGCPVVELAGDACIDVEHLLRVLYDFSFMAQTAIPLPVIAALIRLTRKYDFRTLLDMAVERLTFENPTTLEAYDALLVDGKYSPTRIVPYYGLLFDILTLARENNLLSVLPCAYYRILARYSQIRLLDGILKRDGTVASLAPVDQRRCLLGREKVFLKQCQPGYTIGWLRCWDGPTEDCLTPSACAGVRSLAIERYMSEVGIWALVPDFLNKAQCKQCLHHIEASVAAGRKRTWDELPSFFDLLAWDELKNDL
ncbi:hypothetical protein C8R46DRAFT_979878 [Mycena filopes]|nr:hypothetical protein C8R46DRAFT_979878 [Mycena filopes]